MNLFNVMTVKDTRKLIDENFNKELDMEFVDLLSSTGRILKNDIISPENVPPFKSLL